MQRIVTVSLKLGVSAGLLYLLYRQTPLVEMHALIAAIDLGYLLPIGLLLFVNTVISAWKWQLFLRADGVVLPLRQLVTSYMSGTFCNLFLPSNIGGDSYRIYDIAKASRDGARSAASVFADRFSGFLALVVLSLLSSFYVAAQFDSLVFLLIPSLLLLFFLGILWVLSRQNRFRRLLLISGLGRIGAVARIADKLLLSFSCYGANRSLLTKVMSLSFLFQGSLITVVYLMAKSLGAQTGFFYFSAFVPLITLMEALPISIYGLGIRDYGYVFFFTRAGMSDIETRTLALFFLVVAVCYSLIGGLFFLYRLWAGPSGDGSGSGRAGERGPETR